VPGWLRHAGHGRAEDGTLVTYTVAEGRRGRRWREVVVSGEARGIRSSLLLELDPDGRFSHLELSTAAGLLTLHPEPDGSLHGNAVTAAGVRHVVAMTWDADDAVLLEGSAVCTAAAAPNAARARGTVRIGLDLELARVAGAPSGLVAGSSGLPPLRDGGDWPLEQGV
jgi:hypothetical protein